MTELAAPYEGRFGEAPDLRALSARGAIVNTIFQLAVALLALIRGFAIAALVTQADYGVWGLLALALWTAMGVRYIGVNEKYVQQAEADQELAFQRAFTIELVFAGAATVALAAVLPAMAAVSGHREIIGPGLVLVTLLPAAALQFPVWAFNRRMDFSTQRKLQALEPLAATVVTIGLAALGAGYWSFVGGVVAGAWAAAAGAVRHSPFPLAIRFDRATLRTYAGYSWPLAVSAFGVLAAFQTIYLVGSDALGIAALGAFTLAGNILTFSDRADAVVTDALFPALCAVRDRTDALFEALMKSNRLALLWAVPFGVGLSLFAADLVDFVLGDRWEPAVAVLQVMGLVAALRQVGFNWHAVYRARGETVPIAISAAVSAVVLIATSVPLMYAHGLSGLAWAFAITEACNLIVRWYFLRRFFPAFRMAAHLVRAVLPSVAAAAVVLGAHALQSGERSAVAAVAELVAFGVVVAVASIGLERALLREAAALALGRRAARA